MSNTRRSTGYSISKTGFWIINVALSIILGICGALIGSGRGDLAVLGAGIALSVGFAGLLAFALGYVLLKNSNKE